MPKVNLTPHPRDAIPRNIRILLAAYGMRQTDLARRLNVTQSTVSGWLNGTTAMSVSTLDRIAEVLHTTPAQLYTPPQEFGDNCKRLIC